MTLPVQVISGAKRANKSTGPRTEAGKARSRTNAVKHGMTAKVVLLPDEKPAEFRGCMTGYFDSLKPRNQLEIGQVERIAYLKWQLDRAIRAVGSAVRAGALRRGRETESRGAGGRRADAKVVAGAFRATGRCSVWGTTGR